MNEAPLIEQDQANTDGIARMFTVMAERVQLNSAHSFGGAFVIVPPVNGGTPLEVLILDTQQDVIQFWTFLKTKAELTLQELKDNSQRNNSFGRR